MNTTTSNTTTLVEGVDYVRAIWAGDTVTNKGELPLWSGKGELPAIGADVPVNRFLSARVEGYSVEGGWLMLDAQRSDGKRGTLAGAEIAWNLVGAVVREGDAVRVDLGKGMVPATFIRARLCRRRNGIDMDTLYVVKVRGKERSVARVNISAAL